MLFCKVEIRRLKWFRYIDLYSLAGCRLALNLSLDWRRLRPLTEYSGFYFTSEVDCQVSLILFGGGSFKECKLNIIRPGNILKTMSHEKVTGNI